MWSELKGFTHFGALLRTGERDHPQLHPCRLSVEVKNNQSSRVLEPQLEEGTTGLVEVGRAVDRSGDKSGGRGRSGLGVSVEPSCVLLFGGRRPRTRP